LAAITRNRIQEIVQTITVIALKSKLIQLLPSNPLSQINKITAIVLSRKICYNLQKRKYRKKIHPSRMKRKAVKYIIQLNSITNKLMS